jgi:hypothetical protein
MTRPSAAIRAMIQRSGTAATLALTFLGMAASAVVLVGSLVHVS